MIIRRSYAELIVMVGWLYDNPKMTMKIIIRPQDDHLMIVRCAYDELIVMVEWFYDDSKMTEWRSL